MKKLLLLAAAAAAVLATSSAQAAVVSFSDAYSGTTNWSTVLSLPKFDTSLGTLQQVELLLMGDVQTIFRFENRSSSVRDVSQTATVTLAFGNPGAGVLVVPLAVNITVAAFDGVRDYGGDSGYTTTSTGSQQNTRQWTALLDDLSPFTGPGLLDVNVSANGVSTTLSGNRDSSIATTAAGSARISYLYGADSSAVPEPGSLALVLAALTAGTLVRRRRA